MNDFLSRAWLEPSDDAERVLIIGAGAGGLAAALHLAPMPVTVLTQSPLGVEAATGWAQGGIAAAIGADDAPELHAADTEKAGAGLVDPKVARRVASAAPQVIEHLLTLGMPFDRAEDGSIALGLEAAHSRRRITHAGGDSTGRETLITLVKAARRTPSIRVLEGARAVELVVHEGRVRGAWIAQDGQTRFIAARAVVLATGGLGALYSRTTNPAGAVGSGLALAARAGAVLRDMEFVQFHPTAILTASNGFSPMPLATEALRGEGALLVNAQGRRIMEGIPGAELAPRDVVARAVERCVASGEAVFLDARKALGTRFAARFPSVEALCRKAGIDPAVQPIPIRPAAHYHMGGVRIDASGRTSLEGLWACGEVSSSGLHGANRLASNSLLEALAYGRWIAQDISGTVQSPIIQFRPLRPDIQSRGTDAIAEVRQLMTRHVGVIREREGLITAAKRMASLSQHSSHALTGLIIALAALRRTESRGAQFRSDFPETQEQWRRSTETTLHEARAWAAREVETSDSGSVTLPT
ncbi:MAG TPA: L-aspartate oxidase [Burkholderiales bacterium]|nr:L-aspartate oxidase [Burkholderiales bacterium]